MKDFFSALYEALMGIYDSNFSLIFDSLYIDGGYILLGFIFITVPILMFVCFYFLFRSPYVKLSHWFLWLLLSAIISGGATWLAANDKIIYTQNSALAEALADAASGYLEYAEILPWFYTTINGVLTLIIGFLLSILLKRFSTNYIHLPF